MTDMDRRHLLRIAAPAVALPMAASIPVKEQRLVTQAEIKDAFRYFDMMELRAEDLNNRFNILIDMLFETNPENLRAKLNALVEGRTGRNVLVDADNGTVMPYDPSMYDEHGNLKIVKRELSPNLADQVETWLPPPKPSWRLRLASWLVGWRV